MSGKCTLDKNKNNKSIVEIFNEWRAKELAKGASEDDLARVWTNQLIKQRTGKQRAAIAAVLKGIADNRINVGYNSTNNASTDFLLDIKVNSNGTYTLVTPSGEFTFTEGSQKSLPTKSGKVKYAYVPSMEATKWNDLYFKSEHDVTGEITENHQRLKEDIWNNQENALKLFDELVTREGEPNAHTKELRELLEQITDPTKQILNKFKVYINKKADENGGMAVLTGANPRIILNLSEHGYSTTGMSAAEVYVHEMIHMSVEYARSIKNDKDAPKGLMALSDTILDLSHLYEQAAKAITPKMLETEFVSAEEAKARWDYMFNSKDGSGIAEFVAYGMTNENMKNILKNIQAEDRVESMGADQTLWGRISNALVNIYKHILAYMVGKDFNASADERLGWLVGKLWEHNNQTIEKATLDAKIDSFASRARSKVDSTILKATKVAFDNIGRGMLYVHSKTPDSFIGKTVKLTHDVGAYMLNPWANDEQKAQKAIIMKHLEGAFSAIGFGDFNLGGLFAQEGFLNKVLDFLQSDDKTTTIIEKFGNLNNKIDKYRNDLIAAIGGRILKTLGKTNTREQEVLTEGLIDLDIKVLEAELGMELVQDLFDDPELLDQVIQDELAKIDQKVKNPGLRNFYKNQVRELGRYLVTHIGDSSLNMNAASILNLENVENKAKLLNNESFDPNEMVGIIDRLASMYGIKYTNSTTKNSLVKLMKEKPEAIKAVLMHHTQYAIELFHYNAQNRIFDSEVKGETKDLKADWVDTAINYDNDETTKVMKKKGYKKVGQAAVKGYAIYTKSTSGIASFDKQAFAKINTRRQRHNIFSTMYANGKGFDDQRAELNNLRQKAQEKIQKQFESVKDISKDGYRAILGKEGEIANFEIGVEKNLYQNASRGDRRAPIMLAKMIAEISEKEAASVHNDMVFKYIYDDMDKNYRRSSMYGKESGREYIEIGPDAVYNTDISSTDPMMSRARELSAKIWKDMPENVKEQIMKRKPGQQFIAVRRDLVYSIFGMRSPSLLNIKVPGKKEDGTYRSLEEYFEEKGLDFINNTVKLSGDIFKEIVSAVKVDIVIKLPIILIDNIWSNINYSIALGQWPWEVIAGQYKMFIATKEYQKLNEEFLVLRNKIKSNVGVTPADKAEYRRINEAMKTNPVHALMEAGLFTSVEEITDQELHAKSRYDYMIDKYTARVPQIIKDGASMLYMTNKTGPFKFMLMATQYSDFIARATRYHFLLDRGMSKDNALKTILDEFVNYNRVLSPSFQWVNEMGIGLFFKYFFGANKNMLQKLHESPSTMLTLVMAGSMFDTPNPTDALPINKNFGAAISDPLSMVFDKAYNGLTPPALLEAFGIVG